MLNHKYERGEEVIIDILEELSLLKLSYEEEASNDFCKGIQEAIDHIDKYKHDLYGVSVK